MPISFSMSKLAVIVVFIACLAFGYTAIDNASAIVRQSSHHTCHPHHNYKQFRKMARLFYRGHRYVNHHEIVRLKQMEKCSNLANRRLDHKIWNHQVSLHKERVAEWKFIQTYEPYYGYTVFGGYQHWAIPACLVEHESGGENNPSHPIASSGYYQIASITWNGAFGLSYAYEATKEQQDIVATRVWDHGNGASAWTTAAGCGY